MTGIRLSAAVTRWAAVCLFAVELASAAEIPATLPDWSGEWEMVGLTPSDGGLVTESAEELAMRWNRAPFNSDARQAAFRRDLDQRLAAARDAGAAPAASGFGFACTFGFPTLMIESPTTFEALITPRQTALVFSSREVRNIYTDGRPHTPAEELWPTAWGDSIGHWDQQTLVIDTIAVDSPFQPAAAKKLGAGAGVAISGGSTGGPAHVVALFSQQARYIERIRQIEPGLLELELTIHDPQALSSAWKLTRQYRRIPAVNRMIFQDCEGDTRHKIVDGAVELQITH